MSIVSRLLGSLSQTPKELELLPQIEQLANAQDWGSVQQLVTDNPTLLGDLASALILELAAAARQQGHEAVALTLEDYLPLLMAARDRGIEQVFREAADADLTGNDALSTEQFSDVPLELADTLQRALALQALFGAMEQPEDLAEAASLWHSLIRHPGFARAASSFRLAVARSAALILGRSFELTGDLSDLEEAIDLWRSGVALSQEDPPILLICLTQLGHALHTHAIASPATANADLDAAVEAYRACWLQAPPGRKAAAAANLAHGLAARSKLTGQPADLDEAIERYAEARQTMSLVARSSAEVLSGQADSLLTRYRMAADPRDLDDGINTQRLAAQRTASDSAMLPDRLYQLANALTMRYDLTGQAHDLEEAIASLHAAIQLSPPGDPNLQRYARSLGECLRRYYANAGLNV